MTSTPAGLRGNHVDLPRVLLYLHNMKATITTKALKQADGRIIVPVEVDTGVERITTEVQFTVTARAHGVSVPKEIISARSGVFSAAKKAVNDALTQHFFSQIPE